MAESFYLVGLVAFAGVMGASLPTGLTAVPDHPSIYRVPQTLRNVFPADNFNRDATSTWWETRVLGSSDNGKAASEFTARLREAQYVVVDDDMVELLHFDESGVPSPVETVFTFPPPPAFAERMVHDGIAYAPECDCVFLAELHPPRAGFSTEAMPWVWRISNPRSSTSTPTTLAVEKVYPSPQLTVANGAYYHNGSVIWAQEGNATVPGALVRMDPLTLATEPALNNFLGLRFNSPNGVALSADESRLYVTNRGDFGHDPAGGRATYEFRLHDGEGGAGELPLRGGDVFTYADAGFPDGIKLDAAGRLYGAVTGGVNVQDKGGKLLGMIRLPGEDESEVVGNVQWVDDWLYIAASDHLYRVRLNATGAQTYV